MYHFLIDLVRYKIFIKKLHLAKCMFICILLARYSFLKTDKFIANFYF